MQPLERGFRFAVGIEDTFPHVVPGHRALDEYELTQHDRGRVDDTHPLALDLNRSAESADRFTEGVRALVAQGKPVAITEFGAATFRGAGDRGPRGLEIVEHDKDTGAPVRLDGEYARDEEGQATYLVTTGPGQLRHRQGPGGPPRRHLPRHALGAQGRLVERVRDSPSTPHTPCPARPPLAGPAP
jgi:hypothetical protein